MSLPDMTIRCDLRQGIMTDHLRRISRALLSVSDKAGLVDFARALAERGVELISTGGTRKALADAGLPKPDLPDLTGFPEKMHGQRKTRHPNVHLGPAALRHHHAHARPVPHHS